MAKVVTWLSSCSLMTARAHLGCEYYHWNIALYVQQFLKHYASEEPWGGSLHLQMTAIHKALGWSANYDKVLIFLKGREIVNRKDNTLCSALLHNVGSVLWGMLYQFNELSIQLLNSLSRYLVLVCANKEDTRPIHWLHFFVFVASFIVIMWYFGACTKGSEFTALMKSCYTCM